MKSQSSSLSVSQSSPRFGGTCIFNIHDGRDLRTARRKGILGYRNLTTGKQTIEFGLEKYAEDCPGIPNPGIIS